MKTVALIGAKAAGRAALVDDEDYDLVMQYRWCVLEFPTGRRIAGPYAVTNYVADGKQTAKLMHNLITGWPLVDHRDHDGLNNQRYNLRRATQAQNTYNRRPTLGTSSAFKGVSWRSDRRKWRAAIKHQGITHRLGSFDTEEEAAIAYNAAAIKFFGEFAYLNEVPSTA